MHVSDPYNIHAQCGMNVANLLEFGVEFWMVVMNSCNNNK